LRVHPEIKTLDGKVVAEEILNFVDNLIGGLQSVANYLNVERFGTQHQV
jgi:hypothetical protein